MKTAFLSFTAIACIGAAVYYFFGAPEAEDAGGDGPRGPQILSVNVQAVSRSVLSQRIEALGTVRAQESVTLTANVTETVRRVNFEDAQTVKRGDVLVELTRREESAQLQEAEIAIADTRRKLARVQDLGRRSLVSESEVDDARAGLEAAEARLQTVRARLGDRLIDAPFDGLLGFREVSVGTLVTPGTRIATLDDISKVYVDFTIPEAALGQIALGDSLAAQAVSQRDRVFEGTVASIGSRIDPVTRAATVRAVLDNPGLLLRPGMLITVTVTVNEHEGIEVPARAVMQNGDKAFVFVAGGDNKAEQREVSLGTRRDGFVEVTAGLSEGEQVVTTGIVKLRDGAAIIVRTDSATAGAD